MKAFTWQGGEVREGIGLVADTHLGLVVFLGEEGRGRRYEKVALGRHRPADVFEGCVYDAHPAKISLPARDGKPEKVFYVLEKPRGGTTEVLVRINSHTSYIRNGQGCWRTIVGEPQTLISGYGAFGDAGRIGNWDDGLVVLRPGDVLKVFPSRGNEYALWLKDGKPTTTSWKDYENIQAVEKAKALVANAAENPGAISTVFGRMRTFTFAEGEITTGLCVSEGATGKVIAFGEAGRGRNLVEVPLVGIEPVVKSDRYGRATEVVEQAAVAKLDEKVTPPRFSWEQPTVKTIYGLAQSSKLEDALLVRVSTAGPYTKGSTGEVKTWKGNPALITSGSGAHGDAGRIGGWSDALLVLREGDVLYVRAEGGYKSAGPWAVYVKDGDLCTEAWHSWKVEDAKSDPAFYVAKGTAPMGYAPSEWIGRIVKVCSLSQEQSGCGPVKTVLDERATGELIRIEKGSVVLNLGWDGRDYHEAAVSGAWVEIENDKRVRRLEGEEAEKRKRIRAEAEELRDKAAAIAALSHFRLAEAGLRGKMQEVAAPQQTFDLMPVDGWGEALSSWIERAKAVIEKWQTAEAELKALEARQSSGDMLVDFSAWHRRGGATNVGDGWVIRPDGTCREPDQSDVPRHKHDGTYTWRLVGPEELAIVWSKAFTAADHKFTIAKRPKGGCTAEQLATVERLEREIDKCFRGATGMSGRASPSVGDGWGLCAKPSHKSKSAPVAPVAPVTPGAPVDLTKVDLGKLFGGAAKRR